MILAKTNRIARILTNARKKEYLRFHKIELSSSAIKKRFKTTKKHHTHTQQNKQIKSNSKTPNKENQRNELDDTSFTRTLS